MVTSVLAHFAVFTPKLSVFTKVGNPPTVPFTQLYGATWHQGHVAYTLSPRGLTHDTSKAERGNVQNDWETGESSCVMRLRTGRSDCTRPYALSYDIQCRRSQTPYNITWYNHLVPRRCSM